MASFSVGHWIVVALIFFVIFKMARRMFPAKGEPMHRLDCGTDGPTNPVTPGNLAIEIILWLCFVIPGLIYSIWRIGARKHACSVCGSFRLIPGASPAATAHRQQLQGGPRAG